MPRSEKMAGGHVAGEIGNVLGASGGVGVN